MSKRPRLPIVIADIDLAPNAFSHRSPNVLPGRLLGHLVWSALRALVVYFDTVLHDIGNIVDARLSAPAMRCAKES